MLLSRYNVKVEFKDWMVKRYVEWRGDAFGNERSVRDFAKSIGVSHSVLIQWMNGKRNPSTRTLPKLAALYPDVYEALGMEPPDPLARFPEEVKGLLGPVLDELQDALDDLGAREISADSPEGVRIFTKILESHGIKTSEKSG